MLRAEIHLSAENAGMPNFTRKCIIRFKLMVVYNQIYKLTVLPI